MLNHAVFLEFCGYYDRHFTDIPTMMRNLVCALYFAQGKTGLSAILCNPVT